MLAGRGRGGHWMEMVGLRDVGVMAWGWVCWVSWAVGPWVLGVLGNGDIGVVGQGSVVAEFHEPSVMETWVPWVLGVLGHWDTGAMGHGDIGATGPLVLDAVMPRVVDILGHGTTSATEPWVPRVPLTPPLGVPRQLGGDAGDRQPPVRPGVRQVLPRHPQRRRLPGRPLRPGASPVPLPHQGRAR